MSTTSETPAPALNKSTATLWVIVFLLYLVGDTLLTIVGLRQPGIGEANALAIHLLESTGWWSVLLAKILALVFAVFAWLAATRIWEGSRLIRVGVPGAIVLMQLVLTVWNGYVIYT